MTSPVEIANQSLDQLLCGQTVQSINPSDGSLAGDVYSRNYQPRVDALFRSAHWNCARFQAPLTLLRAAKGTVFNPTGATTSPPYPWLYEYAEPSAPYCLKVRFVYPIATAQSTAGNVSLPNTPLTTGNIPFFSDAMYPGVQPVPFVVGTSLNDQGKLRRVVFSNFPYLECVYTARVEDPTIWDSSFTDAAVMTLAAWCAPQVGGNPALAALNAQKAAGIIINARITDGNEGFTTTDHVVDWIAIRGRGATFGAGPGLCIGQWDSMSLPGMAAF